MCYIKIKNTYYVTIISQEINKVKKGIKNEREKPENERRHYKQKGH